LVSLATVPLHAQYTIVDLYDFNCATGGCVPEDFGQLGRWRDGKFYGTTQSGGASNLGTIFSINPDGSSYADLWNFNSTTGGGGTTASLMLAGDGSFYGIGGLGTSNCGSGTVYRFTPPNTFQPLHNFACGDTPENTPFQAKDKNLYGVSVAGVYRLTLKGVFKALPNSSVGGSTFAPLMQASDGHLYGTTIEGGNGCGTIFRLSPSGGTKTIYTFTGGTDQYSPYSPLFQATDGNLYGTTFGSGLCTPFNSAVGTVFQLIPGKLKVTTIHTFSGSDGYQPFAGLVGGPGGSLLGITTSGGANGSGTAFEIGITNPFTLNTVADFPPVPGNPQATLFLNTDGLYYGLAYQGGANGDGYLYKLQPPSQYTYVNVLVEGPVWVAPGVPVVILGDNLGEAVSVTFNGVAASFTPGSNTYLTALVPSAAIDGRLTVTLTNPSGQQQTLQSQQSMHILPIITNLDPASGPIGTNVGVVGGGFLGATKVTFGGVKATTFTINSPTLIHATVPAGAKTGKVVVTTPNGTATSKETFTVN
jgi:uncharacterized repeat protein (TIGR03803 family)